MHSPADRRILRRVIVGPDHGIRFVLRGHPYEEVRISNLSSGGCFALVPHRDARLFERGAILEQLVLLHPELPKDALIATVAYVLGNRPGTPPMEFVGVGIQFLNLEPRTQTLLDTWLDAAYAAQQA
ncbi:MAG TPA: PilZ domain-containing protein [Holophagaceae bacterium]